MADKETPDKEARREYSEDFISQAKDYAVLGLQPPQIAERMGLEGKERENFLFDCTNKLHPLHLLLNIAYHHGEADVDAALITIACSGDVDAMELAIKKREQDRYLTLRKNLFGI
jgi:hypothetical protein